MPQLLRCCCMHDSQNENGEVSCINTGQKGSLCVNGEAPNSCSQGCAISMNQFTTDCVSTLHVIMPLGNDHHNQIDAFANTHVPGLAEWTHPEFFLHAIMAATGHPGWWPLRPGIEQRFQQ